MKKIIGVLSAALALAACNSTEPAGSSTNGELALNNQMDSASYALGVDMGRNLKTVLDTVNYDAIIKGIKDQFASDTDVIDKMTASTMIRAYIQASQEQKYAGEKEEGAKFLEENKTKEGVKTTPSGLQYIVVEEGDGAIPQDGDKVKAKYRGTFINGEMFDESMEEPIEFPVNGVIMGWTEALKMMPVGSKWKLFIPYELAYGAQGRGNIPPYSTLLFDVELVEITSSAAAE